MMHVPELTVNQTIDSEIKEEEKRNDVEEQDPLAAPCVEMEELKSEENAVYGNYYEGEENKDVKVADAEEKDVDDAMVDDSACGADTKIGDKEINQTDVLDQDKAGRMGVEATVHALSSQESNPQVTEVSFPTRLLKTVGERYTFSMRRAVQTVVLYEANRCLRQRYHVLRPFQRKVALFDTARDIIETLDFIPQYLRAEIMFRTATAKIPLSPELTWRKMKVIDREIKQKVIPNIKPFIDKNKTHEEICNAYLQSQYERHAASLKGKPLPLNWEHTHLNVFLVYRMYYYGEDVNPNLPQARDPNPNRVVPVMKPPMGSYSGQIVEFPMVPSKLLDKGQKRILDNNKDAVNVEGLKPPLPHCTLAEKRRCILKEVREHLELLKEFEGVITTEELNQRKRELFSALPSAPEKVKNEKPSTDKPTIDKSDKLLKKRFIRSYITPESIQS